VCERERERDYVCEYICLSGFFVMCACVHEATGMAPVAVNAPTAA